MTGVSEALQIALQHHEARRLGMAQEIYRQILAVEPENAEALNVLRVLAGQTGEFELAVELLQRAIALKGDAPALHNNLGEAYRGLGVRHARLHLLEVDHDGVGSKYALSDDENVAALLSFADLEPELPNLHLDVFNDLRNMLVGRDNNVTCLWTACDCYATRSVYGIEGDGQSSNCGRTNKDGVDFTKAAAIGYERYLALYHTPQEHGGCQGCRFFLMCKGNCPGTALDGDWRNRSALCGVWRRLYERFEEQCLDQDIVPLSISPKRPKVERIILGGWETGQAIHLNQALHQLEHPRTPDHCAGHQDGGHGDHTDAAGRPRSGHGDHPHGDSHGDHTDGTGGPALVPESKGHQDHADHRDHGDHADTGRR